MKKHYGKWIALGVAAAAPLLLWAADHADAPVVASDQGAGIADVYAFLDPNDDTKAILAFDVHGFIVAGENGNLGGFDPDVMFRLNMENTSDAKPDKFIEVKFDEQTSRSQPQTAHIKIPAKKKCDEISFNAPTTASSATASNAASLVVTTDTNGLSFFAGLTDDPFFFDISAFNRFVGSVLASAPNGNLLSRGRDTFAGYNVQMIALSVPVELLTGSAGNVTGVSATTLRRSVTVLSAKKDARETGALIPFARKNEYNRALRSDAASQEWLSLTMQRGGSLLIAVMGVIYLVAALR